MSEREHRGWHSRGYLPHLDAGEIVQAVTFRLADSLPREVVGLLREEAEREGGSEQLRARVASLLDGGHGRCVLRQAWAAAIVEDALLRFDGERYRLVAWVVMPNHVHVVLRCEAGWPVGGVVRSWKSFVARRVNQCLGRSGRLWHPDYFDRFIRDEGHLRRTVAYVHDNPIKAGLVARAEDWPYSSARLMKDDGAT